MPPNKQFLLWDQIFNQSMLAFQQQHFNKAAELLRQIADADSKKAKQWPNYRRALSAHAFALYQTGSIEEALIYQTKLLSLLPGDAEARANFLLLLQVCMGHLPDSAEFRHVLYGVLSQTDIGEYAVIAAQALLKDTVFSTVCAQLLACDTSQAVKMLTQGRLRAFMQTPLLRLLLQSTLIPLPDFECLFRKLRKTLLLAYVQPSRLNEAGRPGRIEQEFSGVLANYLWLTEYAIAFDDEESALIDLLRQRLEAGLNVLAPPSAELQSDLAYLALYQTWLTLPGVETLLAQPLKQWKPYLQPLVKEWQVCQEEYGLQQQIANLTAINGEVSELVRRQYEENPFPRWKHDPLAHQKTSAKHWLTTVAPNLKLPLAFDNPVDVLVAGCGTGLEPVSLARQIETNRFLAVDLSRASLSYALRMAKQLGLASVIDFKQADLMQLGDYQERFDLITSSGVLHHLEEPLAGWQILTGLLKPGGIMLVSLYSEAARQTVGHARQLIAANAWQATPERMRRFRQEILDGKYETLKPLCLWRDFYNLSMFRDLVFHVNEHTFTVPLIKQHLAELGLQFIGMRGLSAPILARYRAEFPDDPHGNDLQHWASFEAQHPSAFASMYGLVLQKPLTDNRR